MRELLHKPFILPLAGAPAAEEDDATDILVEGETYPHAYKAQAQRNADDIAEANGDAPLEYDANDDGIDGIASGAECAHGKDIRRAPHLEEHIDDEHPNAHGNNLRIIGKGSEDGGAC